VSFAGSLWLVTSIRGSFGERPCGMARERGAVREGFRFVASDRLLRAVIASGFVAFIGVGFVIAANPALADLLGAGAMGLGLMSACWGVGVVVGARISPALLRGDRLVTWAVAGFALQGTAHLLVWRLPNLASILVAVAIGGLGGGIADPARQTLIQRRSPDAVRGRVFATMEAVGWTSFAISLIAAGALVERVGIRPSYLISGTLFMLGTLLMVVLARPRGLRSPATPVTAADSA
jgi:MFS family permease